MAKPLSAARILTALRAEGVRVKGYRSWRTHNRNSAGAWGGVNGVLIHHTAGSNSLRLCYEGRPGLPGPLCHTHLSKDGTATMVGHGRANHAGKAAKNAFDAVVGESSKHPRPSAATGTVDGNAHFYGIEIENLGNGRDPYPAAQYDAAVRWAAALCRAHGWGANSVVGHKETSIEGKPDPSFDMDRFRRDVAARLKGSASGGTDEEKDMQLSDQVKIGKWVSDAFPKQAGLQDGKISVQTALGSGYGYAHIAADNSTKILAQLGAQSATIDKLVDAIGKGGGLTAAEIKAAAEAGAQAALDRLGDALVQEG